MVTAQSLTGLPSTSLAVTLRVPFRTAFIELRAAFSSRWSRSCSALLSRSSTFGVAAAVAISPGMSSSVM